MSKLISQPSTANTKRRAPRKAEPLAPKFAVLIFCESEADQRDLYRRFTQEGRKCRLLVL